jgi:hypothetical protein
MRSTVRDPVLQHLMRTSITLAVLLVALHTWAAEGTRVTGTARPAGRNEPAEGLTVELRPSSLAWAPDQKKELEAKTRTTKTDNQGRFHFDHVAPGEYEVVAARKGWSAAEYRVHVSGLTKETKVGKELVLAPLARVEVAISPPTDAHQQPWEVSLARFADGDAAPVASSKASISGQWARGELESGSYSVTVQDENGASVAQESVYVDGALQYVPITIEQVSVRGTLVIGDRPVEAHLRFYTIDAKSVRMTAGENGTFSGVLPGEGVWNVDVTPANAGRQRLTIPQVEIRRSAATGFADVDLELREGRVHGVVVSPDGTPLVSTIYLFKDGRSIGGGRTESDGKFDFLGIAPGRIEISARGQGVDSGLLSHVIHGTEDQPLQIVTAKTRDIRVRVSTFDGRPVAGALVAWTATNWLKDDSTNPHGEVRITLPAPQSTLTLGVVAIGHPLKLTTVQAQDLVAISLPPLGGQLFIAFPERRLPYPSLGKDGGLMTIGAFMNGRGFLDGMPVRPVKGGFLAEVEPGEYTVCMPFTTKCEARAVRAGARETIDATKWTE